MLYISNIELSFSLSVANFKQSTGKHIYLGFTISQATRCTVKKTKTQEKILGCVFANKCIHRKCNIYFKAMINNSL